MPQTNADLGPTEAILDAIDVGGPSTVGALKTGRFIGLYGLVEADPRKGGQPAFHDLFLTRDQAERLRDGLIRLLT